MTQFLYFFPGNSETEVTRERVSKSFARTALRDLLRSDKTWNGSYIPNAVRGDGPGGHSGRIVAIVPPNGFPEGFTPAFVKGKQTWVQIDDTWLGWFTDMPPTEESLRRETLVSGYPVLLNDDKHWTAPTIRCQPAGARITLPRAIKLGSDGQRVVGVKEFYQHWQDLTDKLWQYRFGVIEMKLDELVDSAAELLSLNYRIGPKEVDALGLFDLVDPESTSESNWSDIIAASCDWPLVQEAMDEDCKKKASVPEHLDQSHGSAVANQGTAV